MSKQEKLKELITCSVCLDQFKDPKMLPCQHTFCLPCVRKFGFIQQKQQGLKEQSIKIKCAQCRAETTLPKDGYEYLPGNIYVQSLLDVFSSPSSSNLILSEDDDKRCEICDTLCEVRHCEHCGKNYCPICEQRHLTELEQQLTAIQQQLITAKAKLCHRVKLFMDECDQVKESVHIEIQNRVKQVLETESKLVRQIDDGVEKGKSIADDVQQKLDQSVEKISQLLKEDFDAASAKTAYQKISLFMEIHNTSSQFLKASEIIELGSLSFCPDTLSVIGIHSEGTDEVMPGEDYDLGEEIIQENPASTNTESALSAESEDAHSLYYRSRPFIVRGRLGSAIVQRPCGIAVSPWAKKEIFVVSMDTHRIYVFDVDRRKLLRSFGRRGQGFGEFMCPSGIALSAVTREIYVTDKWKHCIHVFDEAENFVRQIGGKGSGEGQFRSPESISVDNNTGKIYVCDTINNRIQVLSKDGVFLREIDGQIPIPHHTSHHHHYDRQIRRSLFQEPAGIAVTPDGSRLVVCDFANHRIHVFNTRDGLHLFTCGQKGSLRGQFNNPECVAVDNKGFIFVGDSGNSRVQILRPDGRFIRCFGNRGALPGHFNWISGLILTHTKEVVVSDFKNHCVQIF